MARVKEGQADRGQMVGDRWPEHGMTAMQSGVDLCTLCWRQF